MGDEVLMAMVMGERGDREGLKTLLVMRERVRWW